MSKQAEIIASYVTRVGDLQRQRQEVLADDELKRVALELGLKPADIARADQAADEHLTRAAGYTQHGMLDDAVDELRAAVVLRPLDPAVILALAEAYAARWRARRAADDREQADQLARQVLQMDPNSTDAFTLRRDLSSTTTAASSHTSSHTSSSTSSAAPLVLLLVGGAVVVFLGVAVAGAVGYYLLAPQTMSAPVPLEASEPSIAAVAATDSSGALPVHFTPSAELPGAVLSGGGSELAMYDDSWSYRLAGRLTNGSSLVVTALEGEVLLKAADGTVVARDVFDVQQDYEVELRPGEVRGFDTLIYTEGYTPGFEAPVTAELRIFSQSHETAAARYPDDTPVALSWGAGGPPPGVSVSAARRSSTYTESFGDKLHHRAEVVFTIDEGSASVELLKVRLEHLDADGAIIEESDDSYVVSTSEPPLEPGEGRGTVFLSYVPTEPASERLVVIEAR